MSGLRLALLLIATLFLSACVNTQRCHILSTPVGPVFVNPVMAPDQEIAVVPTGYIRCRSIRGKYCGKVWVPRHRICRYYPTNRATTAWVDGYWHCIRYIAAKGVCLSWQWKTANWSQTYFGY